MFRGKTKNFLSLLASLAMIVTAVTGAMTVSAETDSGSCGEGVTWSFDSSTGKLTISGEGEMITAQPVNGNIELGDFYDIYSYKKYKESIIEVEIEEGVTSIGYCAFYQFPKLETVSIPSTIKEFSAFYTGSATTNSAFKECQSLKNLKLADDLTCLGAYTFSNCTSLESVTIPKSIVTWEQWTFRDCSSLKDITLPDGLTVMGGGAFRGTGVESIYIPSSIQKWNGTSSYFGAGGNEMLYNCKNLKSVTFGDGITQIPWAFLYGCTSLEEVAFGDDSQITEIGKEAFRNCTNLKRVEIPNNVTSFGNSCFNGCNSLITMYIYSERASTDSFINMLSGSVKVYSYYGSVASTEPIIFNDIEDEISKTLKELKTAVSEADKYSEKDYTEESYGVLKALLDKAATKNEKSHILGMEHLTKDIYTAIDGLVDKSNEPSSSDPSSSDPSDSSNPTDNSSDLSNSSDNNNQSQSANTPATPSTSAPTTATPKPTTPPTVTTAAKPAQVKAVKVKAKKKKLNVSWKKVSGATGYEVMSATNNKFTKNKKSVTVKKNKVTLKKLKPKKKYFVKVRAYKLANGNKYFGKWSKVVKKKTK